MTLRELTRPGFLSSTNIDLKMRVLDIRTRQWIDVDVIDCDIILETKVNESYLVLIDQQYRDCLDAATYGSLEKQERDRYWWEE